MSGHMPPKGAPKANIKVGRLVPLRTTDRAWTSNASPGGQVFTPNKPATKPSRRPTVGSPVATVGSPVEARPEKPSSAPSTLPSAPPKLASETKATTEAKTKKGEKGLHTEGMLRLKGEIKCKTAHEETVFSTRFSPDGKLVAAAVGDGTIHVYTLAGKPQHVLRTKMQDGEELPCTAVRWRSGKGGSQILLCSCANGSVQLFDLTSGANHCVWEEGNETLSVDYAPGNLHFASVGSDRIVRLYDEKTLQVVSEMQSGYDFMGRVTAGHSNRIYAAKFAEPNVLLTGGWDKTVQVYDCRTGKSARVLFGAKVSGDGLDVRQSVVLAASCEASNQLQLFEYGSGKELPAVALNRHIGETYMYSCKFSPTGGTVWACGTQPSVMLGLDRNSGNKMATLAGAPGALFCVDVAPDGKTLACGGSSNRLYLMAQ